MKSHNYNNKTIFSSWYRSPCFDRGVLWHPLLVSILGTSIACNPPECQKIPASLFLLLNAIVAFLVGELRLGRPNPSMPCSKDIYEEYVERSGSLQRVSSFSNYGNCTDNPVQDKVGEDKNMGEELGTWEAEKLKDEDDHDHDKGDHENNGGNNGQDDGGGLGADELNKSVEEFIAKVNQQKVE